MFSTEGHQLISPYFISKCFTIILFLKQVSGLMARAIIKENQENLETNVPFMNRGYILFLYHFQLILINNSCGQRKGHMYM